MQAVNCQPLKARTSVNRRRLPRLLSGLLSMAGATSVLAEGTSALIFADVTVVDVEAGTLQPNQNVVVADGKITVVVPARDYETPAGATVIPAAGKYLIPGLWDMHVHHDAPLPGLLDLAVANGVTGVRDLNSEPFVLEWRDEIKSGKRLGPRLIASGKYLDARMNGQRPDRITADTPDQAREMVRTRKQAGVDFIKVYSGLSPEVYQAVLEEARAQGLTVAGHCPERVSALEVSRLGQRSMEHLTGIALASSRDEAALRPKLAAAFSGPHGYDFDAINPVEEAAMTTTDPEKAAGLFAEFTKHKTWQVPTLVTQRPLPPVASPEPRLKYIHVGFTQLWKMIQTGDRYGKLREAKWTFARRTVRAMHQAGVPLLAGTDAGGALNVHVFPGFSLADELELFVECGLTPADALRTATLNPARFFGEEASAGTVTAGKRADLVLLDADPLTAIGNVRRITGVMINGRWLPRSRLDEMLEAVAESNRLK